LGEPSNDSFVVATPKPTIECASAGEDEPSAANVATMLAALEFEASRPCPRSPCAVATLLVTAIAELLMVNRRVRVDLRPWRQTGVKGGDRHNRFVIGYRVGA